MIEGLRQGFYLIKTYLFYSEETHDHVGHLHAWQQLTLARLTAAQSGTDLVYPYWVLDSDPDNDDLLEQTNAGIYAAVHSKPWLDIYAQWAAQFQDILDCAAVLPADVLGDPGRFSWLEGYPLAAVLSGTLEHHREHREPVERALAENRL